MIQPKVNDYVSTTTAVRSGKNLLQAGLRCRVVEIHNTRKGVRYHIESTEGHVFIVPVQIMRLDVCEY